jgi:hypothetical protein
MHEDGPACRRYLKDADESGDGSDGPELQSGDGEADVPRSLEAAVVAAAEDCHGECIFVERESRQRPRLTGSIA